ncbi:MAG: 4-hydroxy-tetrahydrodipicolinate reductase [Ignavibacteriae bacterium]|nr:4-hydroxy-tetrahydrodipicolinate reductase [Ignavibacteria bacterium]MBI3364137.1 4-hydroxy-tetrahydrodipicolinate reductase [Ignavibacteriota bacterium]
MNIALIGYGKMGHEVEQIAHERKIAIKHIFTPNDSAFTKHSLKDVDVCIDFTSPASTYKIIEAVANSGKNIVVGTTGWYNQLSEVVKIVKVKKIGLLYSANFSIGMNLFNNIVSTAAEYFNTLDDYDVAIHEIHHREKKDSPSGSALALGRIVLEQISRKKELLLETSHDTINARKLHVTSERVGHVAGTHQVLFDSEADSIELVHRAKNRRGFALGALLAAEWLKGKKGVYTMNDVIASLHK